MVKVAIEYWRSNALAKKLSEIPGVEVKETPGKSTSFEVFVDGQCIYSKLKTGSFPDDEQVLEMVREMAGDEKLGKNSKSSSSMHRCSNH